MKKYLVLYKAPVSAREQMETATPEQGAAGMAAWAAWAKRAGPAVLDLGAPVGEATIVGGKAAKSGAGHIGGYSILQASSMPALKKLLDGHPHLGMPGFTIEVHELLPLPGM